jgi:acetyl esterase/lipase
MSAFNVLLRCLIKPRLKKLGTDSDIGKLRKLISRCDWLFTKLAPQQAIEPEGNDLSACWINYSESSQRTLLYLHGGAFMLHLPGAYRKLAKDLGQLLDARVLLVDYRLAPEHPFPAAVDDCLNAYRWLIEQQQIPAEQVVIGGDSAGANLSLVTLQGIRDQQLPAPACSFMLSPVLNVLHDAPDSDVKEKSDPLLSRTLAPLLLHHYVQGQDPKDPRLSPIISGSFEQLPPLQFIVSDNELLEHDSLSAHQQTLDAGGSSELHRWHNCCHCHPVFPFLPEAQTARLQISTFVQRHCPTPPL